MSLAPTPYSSAFVIDHLVQRGGAERTMPVMAAAAPGAPVHTAFHEPDRCYDEVNSLPIRRLPIGRARLFDGRHRVSAPLLPFAFSATTIEADVVMCATSGWAHGVRTRGRKIAYFHSLARWIHSPGTYLRTSGRAAQWTARGLRPGFETWDRSAVRTVDRFLTQCTTMRDAVREAYGVEVEVLPPPNSLGRGAEQPAEGLDPGFVLFAGRLMPYKHVDLVLAVAERLADVRIVLAGDGPLRAALETTAPPNVTFLGDTGDAELRWLYRNASCLLTLAEEPFGVTPIEAAALGTATVARAAGGFLDTVQHGVTGRLVEPDPALAAEAVRSLIHDPPDEALLHEVAARYEPKAFTASIRRIMDEEAEKLSGDPMRR